MSEDTAANIDEAIEQLRAALERDQWINLHSYPVEVRSEDGRLVMEGTVENVAAKRRARVLAEDVVGGRWPVDDRLRREPSEKQGDQEIRDQVMDRLSSESMFREYSFGTHTGDKIQTIRNAGSSNHEIILHVDNAAVKLTGSVGSLTHRRFAEVLAWWTYGCETVDNCLGITPAEEDTDAEISDAVRIIFEKDPMFDADQFHVVTSDGVVTLEGL
ncbi:MAG: BON domain-containing protein, partial [Pseudohongiellaceae bacterium]